MYIVNICFYLFISGKHRVNLQFSLSRCFVIFSSFILNKHDTLRYVTLRYVTTLTLCANTACCFTVDCTVDLVWGHTTHSMCIGYMAQQDKKPKVKYESSLISPTLCLRSPSNSNLLCIEGAIVSLTESATRSAVSGGHGL